MKRAVEHFGENSDTVDSAVKSAENQQIIKHETSGVDFEGLLEFNTSDVVDIVPVGMFHGEDIPSDFFMKTWFGLYTDGLDSWLKKVEVDFSFAFDPLLDMLGERTAIKVTVANDTLNPVVLISGVEEYVGRRPDVILSNKDGTALSMPHILEPGYDLFLHRGLDAEYLIRIHADLEQQNIVELIRKGQQVEHQVFAGAEEMDDARMDIRWVGDLNGDSRPDFLLNIAHKYSYAHWALYLSDPSGKQLLLPVADLRFTSC